MTNEKRHTNEKTPRHHGRGRGRRAAAAVAQLERRRRRADAVSPQRVAGSAAALANGAPSRGRRVVSTPRPRPCRPRPRPCCWKAETRSSSRRRAALAKPRWGRVPRAGAANQCSGHASARFPGKTPRPAPTRAARRAARAREARRWLGPLRQRDPGRSGGAFAALHNNLVEAALCACGQWRPKAPPPQTILLLQSKNLSVAPRPRSAHPHMLARPEPPRHRGRFAQGGRTRSRHLREGGDNARARVGDGAGPVHGGRGGRARRRGASCASGPSPVDRSARRASRSCSMYTGDDDRSKAPALRELIRDGACAPPCVTVWKSTSDRSGSRLSSMTPLNRASPRRAGHRATRP